MARAAAAIEANNMRIIRNFALLRNFATSDEKNVDERPHREIMPRFF